MKAELSGAETPDSVASSMPEPQPQPMPIQEIVVWTLPRAFSALLRATEIRPARLQRAPVPKS